MKDIEKKEDFIINYIIENGSVNMLDSAFVDAYIKEFNCNYKSTFIGAKKCPELSKVLGQMYKEFKLSRQSVGISNMVCDGFPKWIYDYDL